MRYLLIVLFAVITFCGVSQTRSVKRGLGYGHHGNSDLAALSAGVSWYYNWYHQPEMEVFNTYDDYGFDYVPMAWNGSFNKQGMHDFLSTHPNVKYILGWNEPNFKDQANMTPSQAAAMWPEIEALADEFGLEIVSPAVNFCGNCVSENGTTYTDPVEYLDDFFEACEGCRVDHIAIHCYMNDVSALQWYVGLFKKYGKPIWLTEFAAWEGQVTLDQQKRFMVGAVEYLESDPDVFRYAWFTGRHTGAPYIGILDRPGSLTPLGEIYVNMPTHDPDFYTEIPARIEAENYSRMDGIGLELTQDVSGIANVGFIDAGDWLEYNINVPADGTYFLYARVASVQNTSIEILKDDVKMFTLPISNTNGYQQWKTFELPVTLTAGEQTLRFKAVTSGFSFNWIDFREEAIVATEEDVASDLKLYPNPTKDFVQIESSRRWKEMEVMNVLGVTHRSGAVASSLDMRSFSPGTYLVKFTDVKGRVVFRRIVRE